MNLLGEVVGDTAVRAGPIHAVPASSSPTDARDDFDQALIHECYQGDAHSPPSNVALLG